MNKRIIGLTLCAGLMLSLAACSLDSKQAPESTQKSSSSSITPLPPVQSEKEKKETELASKKSKEVKIISERVEDFYQATSSPEAFSYLEGAATLRLALGKGIEIPEGFEEEVFSGMYGEYSDYYADTAGERFVFDENPANENAIRSFSHTFHYSFTAFSFGSKFEPMMKNLESDGSKPLLRKVIYKVDPKGITVNDKVNKASVNLSSVDVTYDEKKLFDATINNYAGGPSGNYNRTKLELVKKNGEWFIVDDVWPTMVEASMDAKDN